MDRRKFIKVGSGSAAIFIIPPSIVHFYEEKGIKQGIGESFLNPPFNSKPYTWWHWMNGNVSEVGITLDLEFLKKAGLGGFQLFQVGTGIPKGPVNFGGTEWLHLLQHAAKEADRLGLEYDMMNGGGWSSSGGPWITPELAMQQLTWSETNVKGGGRIQISLQQPYTKLGFYKDAFVLAFPTPGGTSSDIFGSLTGLTSNQGSVDKQLVEGGIWPKGIDVSSGNPTNSPFLQFQFSKPVNASSIMIYGTPTGNEGRFFQDTNSSPITLNSSNDGINFKKVCDIDAPHFRDESLEVPVTKNFGNVTGRFFRLIFPRNFRLFQVRFSPATCITEWPLKANYTRRGAVVAGELLPASVNVPSESVIAPDSVLDISPYMDESGQLNWDAPNGNWTIIRMGHTAVGVKNHPAPDGGLGLECDKYSQKAYDFHFYHFFGKLLPFLESMGKKGMSGSVIDSYEVGMQTWTEEFPQEFLKRRGYGFTKYLPALVGYVVGSGEISDRFLWDIRRTEADMMGDNYFGRYVELCHRHNMIAYCEPYSGGPFDEIQSGSKMDIPMGEFWCGMDQTNGVYYSTKLVSSIAHIYGKKVVGDESYTGIPSQTKWQMYPYAMKGQGDWMFTQGLNRFTFHVYAMQPNPTAVPGMTMGPWGWMHSRNNTWQNEESSWLKYVHRTQYILQEGVTVADLVYFVGEDIPTDTPVLPGQLLPHPPVGYYYDVTDGNGILARMEVKGGRIILPDGMSYKVLVIPSSTIISLSLLKKIKDLVKGGICLVGPKPKHTPGLSNFPNSDTELQGIADEIWGDIDGKTNTHRVYGDGMVFWGEPLESVLQALKLLPDFECTSRSGDAPINYIHRTIGDSEVYFIANRRRQSEDLVCTFRVKEKKPEFWDPETGEIIPINTYEKIGNRMRLPISLNPASSIFVVFRSPVEANSIINISKNDKRILSTQLFPKPVRGRYASITNSFSITGWVKPDVEISIQEGVSFLSAPVSFVFYPLPGNKLYGEGHATCGLVVGRNGVVVCERSGQTLKNVLSVAVPLSGWTQLSLIYIDKAPRIYLNGKLVGTGISSDSEIHPGLNESYQEDGATYFHGEIIDLRLSKDALNETDIQKIYKKGLPAPHDIPVFELKGNSKPQILFWQNGKYTLSFTDGRNNDISISEISDPVQVIGPWEVTFPPNLGAPDHIELKKLISLKDHPNNGVKYFSGTMTYHKNMEISHNLILSKRRLYLDLGWVDVVAKIRLNGKDVGTLWKRPYYIDITEHVKPGDNELAVEVTNLWPNRLIGDEHLPAENEYGSGGGGPMSEFSAEIKKLPNWYVEGKPKPAGGRITFATWKHYSKNDPLLESGLLGPVFLRTAVLKPVSTEA